MFGGVIASVGSAVAFYFSTQGFDKAITTMGQAQTQAAPTTFTAKEPPSGVTSEKYAYQLAANGIPSPTFAVDTQAPTRDGRTARGRYETVLAETAGFAPPNPWAALASWIPAHYVAFQVGISVSSFARWQRPGKTNGSGRNRHSSPGTCRFPALAFVLSPDHANQGVRDEIRDADQPRAAGTGLA